VVEKDYEHFSRAMLHMFRASNLMFSGEYELDEARAFSRKVLEKMVSTRKGGLLLRQVKLSKLPLNLIRVMLTNASDTQYLKEKINVTMKQHFFMFLK
jgi:hypothetical protein